MSFIQKYKSIFIFYSTACFLTWVFWIPMDILIKSNDSLKVLHLVGALGPAIAAILCTFIFGTGREKKTLIRNVMPRTDLLLKYLFWFALPFIIFFASILIEVTFSHKTYQLSSFLETDEYAGLGIRYWIVSIVFYGFGEEIGWRGYLFPLLNEMKVGLKRSTIIMAILWAFWHLPLFFYIHSNYNQMNLFMILGWFVSLVFGAFLLNYICLKTDKNLISVALFHAAIDIVVINKLANQAVLSTNLVNAGIMLIGSIVLISWMKKPKMKV